MLEAQSFKKEFEQFLLFNLTFAREQFLNTASARSGPIRSCPSESIIVIMISIAVVHAPRARAMYQELTREMNLSERATLEHAIERKPLSLPSKGIYLCACGLAFSGMLGLGIVTATSNPVLGGIFAAPFFLFALICICGLIMIIEGHWRWKKFDRQFEKRRKPELVQALKNGQVKARKISATAVVEIVEFEDEGLGYVFDIGDRKSLFLKGQRFDSANGPWPNSDFEIVHTSLGNQWLGIFCHGKELKPTRTLETADLKRDFVFGEYEEVIDSEMNEFANSLLKSAKTRAGA